MNLADVIESLVEERGLEKEEVIRIVCKGVKVAYSKKFPDLDFEIQFNRRTGDVEVFTRKEVVSKVDDEDHQISFRRAKTIDVNINEGDFIAVPFAEKKVGRIEILTARQIFTSEIRELEQRAVYDEYKEKEGLIVAGVIHKQERNGFSVKVGDVMALLPQSCVIPGEILRVGSPVRALLKEVLSLARGDYQLILDRSDAEFVKKLIELEIPEVFEGLVRVRGIARIPGYKTKVIVGSTSKEIDPVGTCVGVGGARIKPILRELGREKIDLIAWTDDLELLVENSLKPAEIDKVEFVDDGKRAIVWLAQDQRSFAIGKMGKNIALASRLTGVEVQLQDIPSFEGKNLDLKNNDEEIDFDEQE